MKRNCALPGSTWLQVVLVTVVPCVAAYELVTSSRMSVDGLSRYLARKKAPAVAA